MGEGVGILLNTCLCENSNPPFLCGTEIHQQKYFVFYNASVRSTEPRTPFYILFLNEPPKYFQAQTGSQLFFRQNVTPPHNINWFLPLSELVFQQMLRSATWYFVANIAPLAVANMGSTNIKTSTTQIHYYQMRKCGVRLYKD